MKTTPHIAVIGAGLAGLSCATELQHAGLRVTVFDQSRGPGGRMSTRRGDGWQCDHGAQYITARHPLFRAELRRWQSAGVAGVWRPRLAVLGDADEHTGGRSTERYVGVPRMNSPARLLADALTLSASRRIMTIARSTDGWRISSQEHGTIGEPFAALALALPAPQAAPLLDAAAPELARLARGATMRGSWALMLRFAAPLDLPFDAAFVNHGPLRWIARDNSKPGRPARETWLLHARAPWSEAHIDDASEAVAAALIAAFSRLGAPAPAAWTAHRWRYADSAPALTRGCVWEAPLQLGLCGDWLNGGKVEGAWLSGHALAQEIRATIDGDASA